MARVKSSAVATQIAVHHRVALGLSSLMFGAMGLSLSVVLLAQSGSEGWRPPTTPGIKSVSCLATYECSFWSACTDGQRARTCILKNSCVDESSRPAEAQYCSDPVRRIPTEPTTIAASVRGDSASIAMLDSRTLQPKLRIQPFAQANRAGVFVGAGDLDANGDNEVVAGTGAGQQSVIRVFSSQGRRLLTFAPFGARAFFGATVGVGDIDRDGFSDVMTGPATGPGPVRFFRYDSENAELVLTGAISGDERWNGVNISVRDLDLDGRAEVILSRRDTASGYEIYEWDGSGFELKRTVKSYPSSYASGIVTAAGDVTGDGRPEVVSLTGPGYRSLGRIYTAGGKFLAQFYPFPSTYYGGGSLVVQDVDRDGRDEILVSQLSGGKSEIRVFGFSTRRAAVTRTNTIQTRSIGTRTGLRLGGN